MNVRDKVSYQHARDSINDFKGMVLAAEGVPAGPNGQPMAYVAATSREPYQVLWVPLSDLTLVE